MVVTLDEVDDRPLLLRRVAGLVADMIVPHGRLHRPVLPGPPPLPDDRGRRIQWSLLPPLLMTPQVEVVGILEPAYDVAGDSFDDARNDDDLHDPVIDAMGHGVDAATMSSTGPTACCATTPPPQAVARTLTHALERERGALTSDDATILLTEWRGEDPDRLATLD